MSLYSSYPALFERVDEPRERWALVLGFGLSALLHVLFWMTWQETRSQIEPQETPAQIIEVALMSAPPPQAAPAPPAPPPPMPPKAEPQVMKPLDKPPPRKVDKPRPKPISKPRVEPRVEPTPVTVSEAASSAAASTSVAAAPVQAAAPSAPAPYVEASYRAPGLNNPPTRYPRLALERHWEGQVLLKVQVLADGRAGEIRIERSSGHEILDESTVEQVKQWRFIPARRGDQAVVSWVLVPIEYKLKH